MSCARRTVKEVAFAVLVWFCISSPVQSQVMPAQGKFVNVSAPGNLAPTRKLSCMDIANIKNIYTPPDIYTAIRDCLSKGLYDQAASLYPLASAYAHFDAFRVADQTARDGGQVLSLQTFATQTPEQKQAFKKALTAVMSDPQKHSDFCANVSRIGPPNYFPKYLIMHGMNAFTSKNPDQNALIPNFDAKGTWAKLQTQYLQCAN
jgi:hypothetical protein